MYPIYMPVSTRAPKYRAAILLVPNFPNTVNIFINHHGLLQGCICKDIVEIKYGRVMPQEKQVLSLLNYGGTRG